MKKTQTKQQQQQPKKYLPVVCTREINFKIHFKKIPEEF